MIKLDAFQELLEKEVSRKEFLQIAGAAILGVIGFTSFVNNLMKFTKSHSGKTERGSGYGNASYGR